MGNVFARKKIFKWSIQGFSSIENNIKSGYYSGYFEAKGYRWRLVVYSDDKTSYLRLGLCLDVSSLPSYVALKVDYKLGIYDELHGNHKWKRGNNYFAPMRGYGGWCLGMMTMKRFKSPANGFLINDGCFLSAEVTNASPVVRHIGASERSFVQKQMISYSKWWTIRDFSTIQKSFCSEVFEAGRLNWHLKLEKRVDFIVLSLKLDESTTILPNSAVNVQFALRVMDQVEDNHKHLAVDPQPFSSKINKVGKILHLEDLQNPSNGFLVNDTCIIEASVAVLGLSSYHDVLLSHYNPF